MSWTSRALHLSWSLIFSYAALQGVVEYTLTQTKLPSQINLCAQDLGSLVVIPLVAYPLTHSLSRTIVIGEILLDETSCQFSFNQTSIRPGRFFSTLFDTLCFFSQLHVIIIAVPDGPAPLREYFPAYGEMASVLAQGNLVINVPPVVFYSSLFPAPL